MVFYHVVKFHSCSIAQTEIIWGRLLSALPVPSGTKSPGRNGVNELSERTVRVIQYLSFYGGANVINA